MARRVVKIDDVLKGKYLPPRKPGPDMEASFKNIADFEEHADRIWSTMRDRLKRARSLSERHAIRKEMAQTSADLRKKRAELHEVSKKHIRNIFQRRSHAISSNMYSPKPAPKASSTMKNRVNECQREVQELRGKVRDLQRTIDMLLKERNEAVLMARELERKAKESILAGIGGSATEAQRARIVSLEKQVAEFRAREVSKKMTRADVIIDLFTTGSVDVESEALFTRREWRVVQVPQDVRDERKEEMEAVFSLLFESIKGVDADRMALGVLHTFLDALVCTDSNVFAVAPEKRPAVLQFWAARLREGKDPGWSIWLAMLYNDFLETMLRNDVTHGDVQLLISMIPGDLPFENCAVSETCKRLEAEITKAHEGRVRSLEHHAGLDSGTTTDFKFLTPEDRRVISDAGSPSKLREALSLRLEDAKRSGTRAHANLCGTRRVVNSMWDM